MNPGSGRAMHSGAGGWPNAAGPGPASWRPKPGIGPESDRTDGELGKIIDALPQKNREFVVDGRTYRIVRRSELAQFAIGLRYAVAPQNELQSVRERLLAGSRLSASAAAAHGAAFDRMVATPGQSGEPSLLLLRLLPAGSAPAAAGAPAMTPSQLARARAAQQPPENVHWITILLVDELGDPVADEAYRIVAPGGAVHTGRTDADGQAHVSDILAGQCKVSFVNRDQEAWKKA